MTRRPKARPGAPTARGIAEALARQAERHKLSLRRLADWPDGMPALSAVGSGTGPLYHLVREGLAETTEPDRLCDVRFRLTGAGRAMLAGENPTPTAPKERES